MVNYNSKDKVYSGVPLGGIGAGKLEIFPDGTFGSITIKNNWPAPLGYRNPKVETSQTEHVPGFHMAVRTKYNNRTAACLLQAVPLSNYPTTERISYHGEYPFTKITYYPKNVPVVVNLEAFSPLVLGDVANSSYPGVLFNFELKNKSKKRVNLSLLFIFRNIIGNYPTGRYNLVKKAPVSRTILFTQDNPQEYDHTYGNMLYTIVSPWGKLTHHNGWNMCSQNFKFDATSLSLPFWQAWVEKGELPDSSKAKVSSGSYELGTAINVAGTIKANGKVQLKAVLAWSFPRHPLSSSPLPPIKTSGAGSMGEGEGEGKTIVAAGFSLRNNNERKLKLAATSLIKNASNLRYKTLRWQNIIKQSSMPEWLADALINNLYVLTSGSVLTKDGKFALFEAPVECPYLGTLDVRFYGSLPLALFFPELEKSELLQLAQAQRPGGYIPHDLGWNRMDSPTDGTTMLKWKDLCPKFILMVSRYWLWHKDNKFLEDMYPVCKQAMLWELNTDKNNDYLPDNEGADQTFDLWQFYGANSYTSGIYLASLVVLAKMAKHVGDVKFSQKLSRIFVLAQQSFISKLWNETYFSAANNFSEAWRQKGTENVVAQFIERRLIKYTATTPDKSGNYTTTTPDKSGNYTTTTPDESGNYTATTPDKSGNYNIPPKKRHDTIQYADGTSKTTYFACTSGQLMGQWFSHMLNLGYILPQWYVKKALKTLMEYNANMSEFGAVNSMYPNTKVHGSRRLQPASSKERRINPATTVSDISPFSKGHTAIPSFSGGGLGRIIGNRGIIDTSNSHASNVWPGISYALSALFIYEGMIAEGLALAKKVWDNIVHNQRSPWNQPDVIDTKTGAFGFGDHYMRNMVIWAVPLALARHDKKIGAMFNELKKK